MLRRVIPLLIFCLLPGPATSQVATATARVQLTGLADAAEVIRDTNGIAHIRASNEHDVIFLQGYTHAQDRFFQMDFLRHLGNGTLAELVGTTALPQDVQLRTYGIRRAATRSMGIQSARIRALLQAYADGVNAYVSAHPLPPEYGALGITQVDPWLPLDSLTVAKLLTFQLNFNTTDLEHTRALMSYQAAGKLFGFDGAKLFFEDLYRSAPFDTIRTAPDANAQAVTVRKGSASHERAFDIDVEGSEAAERYLNQVKDLEFFKHQRNIESGGSNSWVVSGKFTASGAPILANDPHLQLNYPSIFYPIHLSAGELDVAGSSFAGTPLIILGHNRWMAWGSTASYADVLDFYQEQVVPDGSSPSGLSTMFNGSLEHVIPIPETYRARVGGQLVTVSTGVPAATLIVPRRNNGPIIQPPVNGVAISMQWTGFSATRELEALLTWAEARTPADFERGVRYFAMSQNWMFADRKGNIGYFMSGEIPLREDLEAGTVAGAPPNVLRNGRGGNEWMPVVHPQPYQVLTYEILPPNELPHVVNPAAGWIVNANNDPLGLTFDNRPLEQQRPSGGIYFLSHQFANGARAARISELLSNKMKSGSITVEDLRQIQADTVMRDAMFFVPFTTRALQNALHDGAAGPLTMLAADPNVAEAVKRLAEWDFTTPTGIPEGFDAFDVPGLAHVPSAAEVANSVAATIYTLWRSQFIKSVIDDKLTPYGLPVPDGARPLSALRHLLEDFENSQGVGASGVNFFAAPGITSPADRRDFYILQSLKSALALLASDSFKNAFGNSTNQNDYRWGKLNRLVMDHQLGSIFSVPSAGTFPSPLPNLNGLPVDGGFQTVDPASDSLRGKDENGFVFRFGASERAVSEALPNGVTATSSLPGGISGSLGSPLYANLLPLYLVNGSYDRLSRMHELQGSIAAMTKYQP